MRMRVSTIALVAALSVTVAGCWGEDDEETTETESGAITAPEAVDTDAVEAAAAEAAAQEAAAAAAAEAEAAAAAATAAAAEATAAAEAAAAEATAAAEAAAVEEAAAAAEAEAAAAAAVEDATEAAETAVEEATEAATDAVEAVTPEVDAGAALSTDTFNLEQVIALIDGSSLDDATKATLRTAVEGAQNNPAILGTVLGQVRTALGL